MKKGDSLKLFAVVVVSLAAILVSYNIGNIVPMQSDSFIIDYKASVCVYKNGQLIQCEHNLLYDNGKNITRDALGQGIASAVLNISLCNATAACQGPVAAGTETYNTFTGCGLESTQGTYAVLHNAPGNWSVSKTFTSSCNDRQINATRLTNATGGIFAGNTFTLVTLQSNDQLTINWTLMVT